MMTLQKIRALAAELGWSELWHRDNEKRVRFKKEAGMYVDVWYTRMTVGTVLDHPTKGRGQLFRRNVDAKQLRDIFENPRVHTGKGYYGGGQGKALKAAVSTIKDLGTVPSEVAAWKTKNPFYNNYVFSEKDLGRMIFSRWYWLWLWLYPTYVQFADGYAFYYKRVGGKVYMIKSEKI